MKLSSLPVLEQYNDVWRTAQGYPEAHASVLKYRKQFV